MWKCLKCGTENEWNFCTECRSSKEENEPKNATPQEGVWRCSGCGAEIDGNFCVTCGMARLECVLQEPSMPQDVSPEQPMPHGTTPESQRVNSEERSGKKGCIIAVIVALVIVSLIGGLIFAAFNMLFGSRESVDRVEVILVEEIEVDEIDSDGLGLGEPFNLHFWPGGGVVYIENSGMTVVVPLPPNARMENVDIEDASFLLSQEEGDTWFGLRVILRNQMVDDFSLYSEYEVERTIYWHNEVADVIRYETHDNSEGTLVITYWEDDFGDGISFTLIRPFEGFLLLTELGFDQLENKDEFFEVYGFNENFYWVIQDAIAKREGIIATSDPEDEEDRGEEVQWTSAQRTSYWDLMDEFWGVADPSFDMFFYIWDTVILDDTVLDDYPNADVERLRELHREFDERFDELIGFQAEADFALPYEHEDNQNVFQELRDLITEHQRLYSEFRAALEGR